MRKLAVGTGGKAKSVQPGWYGFVLHNRTDRGSHGGEASFDLEAQQFQGEGKGGGDGHGRENNNMIGTCCHARLAPEARSQ